MSECIGQTIHFAHKLPTCHGKYMFQVSRIPVAKAVTLVSHGLTKSNPKVSSCTGRNSGGSALFAAFGSRIANATKKLLLSIASSERPF